MLISSWEKKYGDTRKCKVMFLFILGGKYFEIRTCQEQYSYGFLNNYE
jgi:hypothetical protein